MSESGSNLRGWWDKQYRWHVEPVLAPALRRLSRSVLPRKVLGHSNAITLGDCRLRESHIHIEGNNNRVRIADGVVLRKVGLFIFGSDNEIHLDHSVGMRRSDVYIFGNNCSIRIGARSTFAGAILTTPESGTTLEIGNDCMFSTNIEVRTGDSHAIFDRPSGERINPGKDVVLGDHVWVGTRALILKGARIPRGCVVAAGSVVSKAFDEESVILAGSPATILRRDIVWSRELQNDLASCKQSSLCCPSPQA
ncbi:MAG: hypothetical protein Fur0032_01730 [Terrimicrobiaceae bacterium]